MNTKRIQGFTLIEMLIVIAVISILAGIVLVGITGFQSSARDTKRIGDLRSIQNSLELYYTRCGFYPQTVGSAGNTCGGGTAIADWGDLTDAFVSTQIISGVEKMPTDPKGDNEYQYGVDADGTNYVLGAILENQSSALQDNDVELDSDGGVTPSVECDDANNGYCLGSS